MARPKITVLGAFVTDLTCRTNRMAKWGETILGNSFKLGPGGKGSNQAVAAARLNADVRLITKLGLSFDEVSGEATLQFKPGLIS